MVSRRYTKLVLGALMAIAMIVATPVAGWAAPAADRTDPAEARRVDSVSPKIDWFDCEVVADGAQCGTVALPLDYNKPRGATTEVALLRIPAANQRGRIGTLFINPGGPGGSGVEFAASAPYFLDQAVLDRFDIVGFDPRGVNFSDPVRCWRNFAEQARALDGMTVPFPFTNDEIGGYVASAEKFGRACSTTGKPLSANMSTANVARDMDVLRRTLGDKQLTYLGFSYGSYLGQVYANMFPDRVRALAIDGVLDPIAWAGTGKDATSVPQTQRMLSGEGADKAMREILKRCKAAGEDYCQLAGLGDPEALYAEVLRSLRREPLEIIDPETGEVFGALTYPDMVSLLLTDMYSPWAGEMVDMDLSLIVEMLHSGSSSADRDRAAAGLKVRWASAQPQSDATRDALLAAGASAGWAFPYDNSPEAFQAIVCTDSRNPAKAATWRTYANRSERSAPGFGALWTWTSAACASSTWTGTDASSYRGVFTKRTVNPVLVVGNYWDPATNYSGAQKAASLLPNSRLLSSDSWGHTAYGTSECVTSAVGNYLLRQKLPTSGAKCVGDDQPFTQPFDPGEEMMAAKAPTRRDLPPVVPPVPGGTPRR